MQERGRVPRPPGLRTGLGVCDAAQGSSKPVKEAVVSDEWRGNLGIGRTGGGRESSGSFCSGAAFCGTIEIVP